MVVVQDINDKVFYWYNSGNQSSAFKWEIVLRQPVNEDILVMATSKAMLSNMVFLTIPVIEQGRVKASVSKEIKHIPVFKEDNNPRKFGSKETYGYLFYLSYQDKKITFHFYHGLTDGHGSQDFISLVLDNYVSAIKGVNTDGSITVQKAFYPVIENILKEYTCQNVHGRFEAKAHADKVFHFPDKRFDERERKFKLFEIEMPLAPLLSLSKSYKSSIVPLIEAIIGNALRQNYDVNDEMIVAYTPIDMRPIFGFETACNGSSSVAIPYRAIMDQLDVGDRAALLKRILTAQKCPDNICKELMDMVNQYKQADSQPYSIEQIVPALKWMETRNKTVKPFTYGLSYLGKINFPDEVDSFVDSIKASLSSPSFPMSITWEYRGIVHFLVTQEFESSEAIECIYKEFVSIIPETKLTDHGIHVYDKLVLEDLEHID